MSICMRCGSSCNCNRHGRLPEDIFYICAGDLKYPPNHKGKCMEQIRKLLDEHFDKMIKAEREDDAAYYKEHSNNVYT